MSNKTVIICILTHKRPAWLVRALTSLVPEINANSARLNAEVLVIDNDAAMSAKQSAEEFGLNNPITINYICEPQQGIPCARNRALDYTKTHGDYLIFIDDDEWVGAGWLAHLISTSEDLDAEAVLGPVEGVFLESKVKWLAQSNLYNKKPNYIDGQLIAYGSTCNLLLKLSFVRQHQLRFDERLRFTGGSDHLFLTQGISKGMRMRWSKNALVYEEVPPERQSVKWYTKRNYRIGITLGYVDAMTAPKSRILRRLVVWTAKSCLAALIVGPVLLLKGKSKALYHLGVLYRGVGVIAGIAGHKYNEYAVDRLIQR